MSIKEVKRFYTGSSCRLDLFLSQQLDQSRNQILHLIKNGCVRVEDKVVTKAGFKPKVGASVCVTIFEAENRKLDVDFDVDVLYEDDHILVVNKPSNLVVHPAPSVKEATLVDWLQAKGIALSTLSGDLRHGIVHRIDKDTSGALVVAKNNAAHQKLSKQLEDKSMGRYYLAVIDMELKDDCIVAKPVARNPRNRLKMACIAGGKSAKTAFKKLIQSKNSRYELIAAKLFTGRTHQIRVHLNSLSRHIVGDVSYGFKTNNDRINRFFLHAYILYLKHPVTGELMYFKAPLPDEYVEILKNRFDMEKVDEKIDPKCITASFTDCSKWMCY